MVARPAPRSATRVVLADLNDYMPPEPVEATTMLPRDLLRPRPRARSSAHVAGYTEKKLVFDLNPRQYALEDVRRRAARRRFRPVELRPFFVPQTVAPAAARPARSTARSGQARSRGCALRFRFTYLFAASR